MKAHKMIQSYVLLANAFMFYCIVNVAAEVCPDVASSIGTDFIFGVIGTGTSTSYITLYIHITVMTNTPAKVRIASPFNNLHTELTVSNYTVTTIPYTHIQTEKGKQFKGIEITSDINISVAVFPAYSSLTEGFLVLPRKALSRRYVAASYYPSGSYYSEILVVGVDSNTDVEINYISNDKVYNNQRIQLNQFESYQLTVTAHDLSRAVITSNKAVAVFSGSSYSQIPIGIGHIQYIVEQMIPQKFWSKRFIVPAIYPHNFFIVKVFADYDNTEIHFYNSTHHTASYMDRGSSQENVFGSESIVILSTKPISVMQYGLDNENMIGNPFMTTVQSVSQYENMYKFPTQRYGKGKSTVAMTLKRVEIGGLSLNGQNISSLNTVTIPVPHPMEEYVTMFLNISYNSFFRLQHKDHVQFGATLYGLLTTTYSYGYPLQLKLSNTDCATGHETGPTSGITYTTSAVYPHTDIPHVNNGNQTNIMTGNGTWCFHCDNMSHLQYCDTVTRCQTDHESCYVQSFTRSNVKLYRSGCMDKSVCQNGGYQAQCQTCCHGNFCNNYGCGDDGPANFDARGPYCFDCEHQGDESCQTVQLCRPDQVCKIEKYEWGSGYHYMMGCTENQKCISKRATHEAHTRHAPVCSQCCHTDFCNMNCTREHVQQIIG